VKGRKIKRSPRFTARGIAVTLGHSALILIVGMPSCLMNFENINNKNDLKISVNEPFWSICPPPILTKAFGPGVQLAPEACSGQYGPPKVVPQAFLVDLAGANYVEGGVTKIYPGYQVTK
jgi:hypothetical protein